MQLMVSYLGMPVVALDAGVARTPVGVVAVGFGAPLDGYAAYRARGKGTSHALELHDAYETLIPASALLVAPVPFIQRVVVFAYLRYALAGVRVPLESARRGTKGR